MNVRKVTVTSDWLDEVKRRVFYTDMPIKDISTYVASRDSWGRNVKILHIDLLDGFIVNGDY